MKGRIFFSFFDTTYFLEEKEANPQNEEKKNRENIGKMSLGLMMTHHFVWYDIHKNRWI